MSLHVYTTKEMTAQALCGFVLRIAAESIAAHQFFRCVCMCVCVCVYVCMY